MRRAICQLSTTLAPRTWVHLRGVSTTLHSKQWKKILPHAVAFRITGPRPRTALPGYAPAKSLGEACTPAHSDLLERPFVTRGGRDLGRRHLRRRSRHREETQDFAHDAIALLGLEKKLRVRGAFQDDQLLRLRSLFVLRTNAACCPETSLVSRKATGRTRRAGIRKLYSGRLKRC